jgi:hypothetical protein
MLWRHGVTMDSSLVCLLNDSIYRLKKLLTSRTYISTNLREQIETESKWVSKIRTILEYGNRTDNSFSSKSKARRIRRLAPSSIEAYHLLSDIYMCFGFAAQWNDLTPIQRITLEEYYTDKVLQLLELGNKHINRSLPYRLREATPEEEEIQ